MKNFEINAIMNDTDVIVQNVDYISESESTGRRKQLATAQIAKLELRQYVRNYLIGSLSQFLRLKLLRDWLYSTPLTFSPPLITPSAVTSLKFYQFTMVIIIQIR